MSIEKPVIKYDKFKVFSSLEPTQTLSIQKHFIKA